ncbi:sensor histidine kinase [Paenibacillus thalictri]|uniref:histidine kinase n=1 Tax=Paenibacillus thalictri TaxID=2527873 RepID=A0A4Q9DU39_9BACL|nr:HAMP domain-containing sensor histidine kinase [Paenibacillus thalictri]TBL80438.1 HAMP domain-containing histidine kinase [Paenibacillus thalictri]
MTILLLILMAASITLFITKARHPSAYWMGLMLLGWFLSMSGLVLFIAKFGGFYYKVNVVLFFNDYIRNLLLHSSITIEGISRMITIGRSLFIFSLIGLSLALFYYRPFRQMWKTYLLNALLPLLNIIFYDPLVYRWLLSVIDRNSSYAVSWITRGWLVVSAVVAVSMMVWRYRRITIPWFKHQIKYVLLGVFALVLFYFYLGFMGPMQVSDVRTYYVLYSDFSNFNPPLTIPEWYIGIGFTGMLSIVSIVFIWKYTEVENRLGMLDMHLERKLKTADMGTKVFTHAIKNQLLMVQLLLGRTQSTLESSRRNEAPLSPDEMAVHIDKMSSIVNETLHRLDQLYKSFKTTYLQMKPVPLHELVEKTIENIQIPDHVSLVHSPISPELMLLVDETHMAEALSNTIINAFEAIHKQQEGVVKLSAYSENQWVIVKIEDNGIGMTPEQLSLIFDPFYTNKNTNKNWGVGLSYVKQIVGGHFGHIHVESTPGAGTVFQLFLPVYHYERSKPDTAQKKDEIA